MSQSICCGALLRQIYLTGGLFPVELVCLTLEPLSNAWVYICCTIVGLLQLCYVLGMQRLRSKGNLVWIFWHISVGVGEGFSHASLSMPPFVPHHDSMCSRGCECTCDEEKLKHFSEFQNREQRFNS